MKSEKLVSASKVKSKDKDKEKIKKKSVIGQTKNETIDKKHRKKKANTIASHKKQANPKTPKNSTKSEKNTTDKHDHIEADVDHDHRHKDAEPKQRQSSKSPSINKNINAKKEKNSTSNKDTLSLKKNVVKKKIDKNTNHKSLGDSEEIIIDDFAIITFESWDDLQALEQDISRKIKPEESPNTYGVTNKKGISNEKRKAPRGAERSRQKHRKIKSEHDSTSEPHQSKPDGPKSKKKPLMETSANPKIKSSEKVGETSSCSRSEESTSDALNDEEEVNDGDTKTNNHELHVSSTISTMSITSSTVVTIKTTTKSFKEDASVKDGTGSSTLKESSQPAACKTNCQASASAKCEARVTQSSNQSSSNCNQQKAESNQSSNRGAVPSIFRNFKDIPEHDSHRHPMDERPPTTVQQHERSAAVMMTSSTSSSTASTRPFTELQSPVGNSAPPFKYPYMQMNSAFMHPNGKTFNDHIHSMNAYNSLNRESPMSSLAHPALALPTSSNLAASASPQQASPWSILPPMNQASRSHQQYPLSPSPYRAGYLAGTYLPPPPPPSMMSSLTNNSYPAGLQDYMTPRWHPPQLLPPLSQCPGTSIESRLEHTNPHTAMIAERLLASQRTMTFMASNAAATAAAAAASSAPILSPAPPANKPSPSLMQGLPYPPPPPPPIYDNLPSMQSRHEQHLQHSTSNTQSSQFTAISESLRAPANQYNSSVCGSLPNPHLNTQSSYSTPMPTNSSPWFSPYGLLNPMTSAKSPYFPPSFSHSSSSIASTNIDSKRIHDRRTVAATQHHERSLTASSMAQSNLGILPSAPTATIEPHLPFLMSPFLMSRPPFMTRPQMASSNQFFQTR